ncbi:MAG: Gfo/Idh/MocA family oxidoreductase [Candidatus Sumerlaeia bacterium]|nr:Gfo/Idh/MocA family oxidoreductase [Candidatus Sumerlaeia bacterium]
METKSPKGVNRREFLKKAAVASAAAATVSAARPGYVAGSDMLKIGLIGCGGRGRGAVANVLRAAEVVGIPAQVVALADVLGRGQEAARSLMGGKSKAVREGINVKPDMIFDGLDGYKKLLATDVNYVMLAAYPAFRPEHFEAAVEAKKQIFTEKPVAVDPVGIRRFMKAAKRSEELGLSVVAGTQRRHQAVYVNTIKQIHDGLIGDIIAGCVYWQGSPVINARERDPKWGDLEWQLRAWYAHLWVSGDNIVEQHVHNLDIANWVLKAHPIRAFGNGGRAWKRRDAFLGNIWDNFSIDYEYPKGVHVFSMSRHFSDLPSKIDELFLGTKGQSNAHDKGDGGLQWEEPYVQEHVHLIQSIIGKRPKINEAMQVAESTFTAILGRESAYQGKPLEWDALLNSDLSYVPKEISWEAKIPVAPVPHPGAPNWWKVPMECL